MIKKRRTVFDKLNTLLFGKDLRITTGDPYTEIRAFDYSSYCPIDKYMVRQSPPEHKVYDIRDFGADASVADNAPYINRAVEQAAVSGGTVLVADGDYVTSTVLLKSNVTLFVAQNASLCANQTGKGYETHQALVFAENAHHITVTGGGRINGNGHCFGRKPLAEQNCTEPAESIDVIEMRRSYRAQLRFAHPSKYGSPIILKNCTDITVDNFMLENSASWTLKLVNCENVKISRLVIHNNRNVANADGIDLAGTSNVDITHCFISTADDGIVIKNALWLGNEKAMHTISVSDCEIISRTNAVKIGTETTYAIYDVSIRDCRLFMTDLYPGTVSGIALESCDGSAVYNIDIRDIEMNRCTCPLFIRLGNRNRAALVNAQTSNAIEYGKKVKFVPCAQKETFYQKGELRDITVKNIKASQAEIPIIIAGYRQKGSVHRVKNVLLENIDIDYVNLPEVIDRRLFIPEYAEEYPESWRFRNLPSYALWSRHTENLTVRGLTCRHPHDTWKKEIVQIDNI